MLISIVHFDAIQICMKVKEQMTYRMLYITIDLINESVHTMVGIDIRDIDAVADV
jgi:hypothetical protein